MLYNLQPDRSVTGGAWYSDQDFESEFVEVLNQQCFKFLQSKVGTEGLRRSGWGGWMDACWMQCWSCDRLFVRPGGGVPGQQPHGPEEQLLGHLPRGVEVHL